MTRAPILLAVLALAGCTDPTTIECGTGWHWVAGNGQYVCVHDTGSMACPADAPYALDLDGGVACSAHPIRGTIPSTLCSRIPGCGADAGASTLHHMGEPCVDSSGCAANEHCIDWEDGRRCRIDCASNAECRAIDPRSSCRAMETDADGGVPHMSCTSPCNPLGPNECDLGYQCSLRDDATYNEPLLTTCRPEGSVPLGTICDGYHPDMCELGAICTYEDNDGTFRCRAPCDVSKGPNACAGGQTCVALTVTDALGYSLGHCL